MPNKAQEEKNLAEADRHIAEAHERIRCQQQRIGQFEHGEAEEKEAEQLLATMLESLSLMEHHRNITLNALADLNRFPMPFPATQQKHLVQ